MSLVSMLCFFETCVNNPGSLLPYAMDARHAPVTLFIVSECDIRLYKEDCKEDRSAWGDQLASHMWPTAQDALDRTLKAAKETAARTAGRPADARAPSPSPAAEQAATSRRAPSPSPAAPQASSSRRAPSPSPAEQRAESPDAFGPDLLSVLVNMEAALPPESARRRDTRQHRRRRRPRRAPRRLLWTGTRRSRRCGGPF